MAGLEATQAAVDAYEPVFNLYESLNTIANQVALLLGYKYRIAWVPLNDTVLDLGLRIRSECFDHTLIRVLSRGYFPDRNALLFICKAGKGLSICIAEDIEATLDDILSQPNFVSEIKALRILR